MVKVMKNIFNDCIDNLSNDAEIKTKIEKDVLIPIINKSYNKLKPYMITILYMYCIIVILLLILILLIVFKKK